MKLLKIFVSSLFLISSLVLAQEFSVKEPDESAKVYKDWATQCDKDPNSEDEICYASQSILLKDKNVELLYIAVGYVPNAEQPLLRLTTPLGTLLPEGMSLQIDGGETSRLPYIFCNQVGCHIEVAMTEKFLDRLKKGNRINLQFVDLGRRDIKIPVSLSGFTRAFNSIKK